LDELKAWAGVLIGRRTHRSLAERLTAPGPWLRGEAIDRRAQAHEPAWLLLYLPGEPYETVPLLPDEADLDACRKPFQLWNVHREIREEPFELEGQEAIQLGPVVDDVLPARPRVSSSCTELALVESFRASEWFAREMYGLRRNRRLRLRHGRPNAAPPPTFVSEAERARASAEKED
jgi:hypothetical protein